MLGVLGRWLDRYRGAVEELPAKLDASLQFIHVAFHILLLREA